MSVECMQDRYSIALSLGSYLSVTLVKRFLSCKVDVEVPNLSRVKGARMVGKAASVDAIRELFDECCIQVLSGEGNAQSFQ